jgi:hypothetical protein
MDVQSPEGNSGKKRPGSSPFAATRRLQSEEQNAGTPTTGRLQSGDLSIAKMDDVSKSLDERYGNGLEPASIGRQFWQ